MGMSLSDFHHLNCMQHYACFACRKAFKVRNTFNSTLTPRPCPNCKGPMKAMGVLFRAPRQRAVKAWKKLKGKCFMYPSDAALARRRCRNP